jgi:hypothetical protein
MPMNPSRCAASKISKLTVAMIISKVLQKKITASG